MHYAPDLVIVFSSSIKSSSKSQLHENVRQAQDQYALLLKLLNNSGLSAVGKRGKKQGDVLILIRCPHRKLKQLAKRERELDFIYGLPVADFQTIAQEVESEYLTPANRIRLLHSYITFSTGEGGLGIVPFSAKWSRVQDILALHDPNFDARWIRSLTRGTGGAVTLDKVKDHYGEAVALYFAFLFTYTQSLTFISAIGALFYFCGSRPYSPYYSVLLLLWSTFFVEYWNVCERRIAVRWRTQGVLKAEKRRTMSSRKKKIGSWWQYDMKKLARVAASFGMLFVFMLILAGLLTGIFILETFIPVFYTGPGAQLVQLIPTIMFAASVPTLLGIYNSYAIHIPNMENHNIHDSTYDASFTIQRFALSTLVSYLSLTLSAFVYVPFGAEVLDVVHRFLPHRIPVAENINVDEFWDHSVTPATAKLDTSRLQEQMFTFTVTGQIMNAFEEIGLPFVMRALPICLDTCRRLFLKESQRDNRDDGAGSNDDVDTEETREDKKFLERIRREVALGIEYDVFEDYSEMVTQFGYVVMWSIIWPIAPVMALLNNYLESRSDAFKITVHCRRPIPIRTDSIGPWLECLRSVTWVAAIVNTILVCLFNHRYSSSASSAIEERKTKLIWALLVSLGASHAHITLRHAMKRVVESVFWRGSKEEVEVAGAWQKVKDVCFEALKDKSEAGERQKLDVKGMCKIGELEKEGEEEVEVEVNDDLDEFWKFDEGVDEIGRDLKDE